MHALSAAEPGSSALTALPTLGLLNRVHDYASAALGRNALSARRFQLFASTTRELSGLSFRDGATETRIMQEIRIRVDWGSEKMP